MEPMCVVPDACVFHYTVLHDFQGDYNSEEFTLPSAISNLFREKH